MCFLKAVGGYCQKTQKCFYIHKNQWNSSSGGFWFSWTRIRERKISPMNDWRSTSRFFRKFSTLLLGHEITLMGEIKSQEFIFKHENSLKWTIKGLLVDFGKNVNFNPWAWNCIFGVFEVSGTQFWQWKFD